jgi:hypothetical protein
MATADLEALRAFRARVYVCLGRRRDALFELLVRTGDVVFAVTFRGLRQAVTPDHLQGWVSATIRVATNGLVPAGAQIEGILGDLVGLRTTMLARCSPVGSASSSRSWCSPFRRCHHSGNSQSLQRRREASLLLTEKLLSGTGGARALLCRCCVIGIA